MSKKAWLIRPKPNGITRISEFLENQIIAVGWPGIGDLSGTREYELKVRLRDVYAENASALSALKMIVYRMEVGDIVLAPQEGSIFFGEIVSGYLYNEEKDEIDTGYPHQRMVDWFDLVLSREELPVELQKSTRVVRTAAELTKHLDTIENVLTSNKAKKRIKGNKQSAVSSQDERVSVTSGELIQRSKDVLGKDLQHEDPNVRLKAAEIVLAFFETKE